MKTFRIHIAKDFSRFPAGRYEKDGQFSGEVFRRRLLVPALSKHSHVSVNLDGTLGYGSSFLEEAFGGLVRKEGFAADELHRRLVLESDDSFWIQEIWSYIDDAADERLQPDCDADPAHP